MDRSHVHLFVAADGDDSNLGTEELPLATLARAREVVRARSERGRVPITVSVGRGTYYLLEPLVFGSDDSGSPEAPVRYVSSPPGSVTISGGRKLDCRWQPFRDGLVMCELPEVRAECLNFTQLFVNGRRQIRARYPNYDSSEPGVSGYIEPAGALPDDAQDPAPGPNDDMTFSSGASRGILFDPDTFTRKRWSRPEEAVIHIYQFAYWGNLQWQVKALDHEDHIIWFGRGGHQMGAKWCETPCDVREGARFYIENVFEVLDAPGEW